MSLPVSIGDILLLSKIAYNIALAFTSGRKSAPAEFIEVENQLFALSTALHVLTEQVEKGGLPLQDDEKGAEDDGESLAPGALRAMITNCRRTLEGMQKVVDKYCNVKDSFAETENDKSGVKLPKRKWSKKLRDNWSKVVWTTEGGTLSTLREQLVVHTTSINLVIGTVQAFVSPSYKALADTRELTIRQSKE